MLKRRQEFNGKKLTEARELHELTIKALSDITQISRQSLSLYEAGKQVPGPDIISRLAEALRLKWDFFFQESAPERSLTTFFRSFASATLRSRTSAMRLLDFNERVVESLEVDLPAVNLPAAPTDNPRKLSERAIELIANECREFWGLGLGPIENLTAMLELNGVIITLGEMDSDSIDAFSRWSEVDGRPYVRLCANKRCAVRSRFDLAHELAHLILHRNIEQKDFAHRDNFKFYERQADMFAGAFLLPEKGFANDLSMVGLEYFKALKPKWKVSIGVMIKRAAQLEFIDSERERLLWIYRARQGWNTDEPYDDVIEIEQPLLLKEFITELINVGQLSREELLTSIPYSADFIDNNLGLGGFLLKSEDSQSAVDQIRQRVVDTVFSHREGKIIHLKRVA